MKGIAYHLTSSNNTQRLDLGSRSRGSGAESTRGNGGASLAEHPERRQHGDSMILANRSIMLDMKTKQKKGKNR